MNRQEAVALARYVKACCPQQAVDEYTPDAWHDLLGDLDLEACRQAAGRVARRQPFVAPAEIRAEVRTEREHRLAAVSSDKLLPVGEVADDASAYLQQVRERVRVVADGRGHTAVPAVGAALPPEIPRGRLRAGEGREARSAQRQTTCAKGGSMSIDRRLLAAMPLHAITATYGEAGLRERFAAEITKFSEADQHRLQRAVQLAAELHADDRRQREPYLNHLLRVTIRVISHYRVSDPDIACAALLHDAVEDHAAQLASSGGQRAALEVLAGEFGARTAELVAAVTNPEWEPGRDEHEQYREHVTVSLERFPAARVIKASDFTDNGVGLIHTTGPKLDRLARKYAPLVTVLRELIARPDTPLSEQAKARITAQLNQAAQRFQAIVSAATPPGS